VHCRHILSDKRNSKARFHICVRQFHIEQGELHIVSQFPEDSSAKYS
jgi:hypothetical protein